MIGIGPPRVKMLMQNSGPFRGEENFTCRYCRKIAYGRTYKDANDLRAGSSGSVSVKLLLLLLDHGSDHGSYIMSCCSAL